MKVNTSADISNVYCMRVSISAHTQKDQSEQCCEPTEQVGDKCFIDQFREHFKMKVNQLYFTFQRYTDKKKITTYIRKFRLDQVQSHI